jgi:hypothetical protein
MEARRLEKNLIFYNPKQPGVIFTYQTGYLVDSDLITKTVSHLEYVSEGKVHYVEERRERPRNI